MRISDWSSDVCSSDLQARRAAHRGKSRPVMSRVMPRTAADAPPLYQQVKDYIVTRILGGDRPEGNRVPSENELTRELSVSRMTVHRALRALTTEGWLERVQRTAGRRGGKGGVRTR